MGWIKDLGEQISKVFTVKIIVIIGFLVILILLFFGAYQSKVKQIGPIKFDTGSDTSRTINQSKNGKVIIEHMNGGDVLMDSSVKYEYHVPSDSLKMKK